MRPKIQPLFIGALLLLCAAGLSAQNSIPIDTTHWEITTKSYILEHYKGKDAIYIKNGGIALKDREFFNGTIEFDIYLREAPMFPGITFRASKDFKNAEEWYIRTHLSGKPDANQATPIVNGIAPWQLYFGPKYSFPYSYNYEGWTHVKLVVHDDKAQVFLDHSETPNLSWNLFHTPKAGKILIRGGNTAIHIANVSIDESEHRLVNFKAGKREPLEALIQEWEISDKFEESQLNHPENFASLIDSRKWQGKITVEEGVAANISRQQDLRDGNPGNTVFAKVVIDSKKEQLAFLEFGYSDRALVILNGQPLYRGTNRWRSRDYRYLGTIGLFDGTYLNLKKGKNVLLIAISEDFGGWLVTGRIRDTQGNFIQP